MKLKKVLSGFVSAAILATSTAFVMPLSASAEDVELSTSGISYTELQKYESLTFTYAPKLATSCDHSSSHTSGETYCPWASIAVIGALENQDIDIKDGKSTNWYQPDSAASAGSGKDEASTTATVKVSAILNSFTTDSDWQDEFVLSKVQFSGWSATLESVFGTPKSADAPVLKPVNATIDEAEVSITKNVWGDESQGQYNYQSVYGFEVTGYTNISTFADIDISTLTLKFKVAGATSGTDSFDPSKISYQINVNGKDPDASLWNWNPQGSSNYNPTTKEVTVTADIEEILGNKSTYEFLEFQLIAMVNASDTTDTVTLKIGEEAVVPVTGITLDKEELPLKKGENATLTATVAPEDATDKTVTWKSSDTKVATVDTTGKVTAVASGTATITATSAADETQKAECEVTVTNPATDIAIDETASVLVGGTKTLAVTTTPADADELTYTWASSDTAVATVADGVVTGVKAGTAKITVTAGTLKAECTVTVTADEVPATKVELDKTTLTLEEEDTATLKATVTPANSTDKITWSSDNEKVATVDNNGKITAVAEGKANIIATANAEQKAECAVTVTAKKVEAAINATISDLKITLAENKWDGGSNWQALEEFTVSGLKASKVSDVKKTMTVKFTVADCDIDASKINYQLNIMCTDGASDWPWLVSGESTYDAKTGEVTITADFTGVDAKYDNYEFRSFRLVAMTDAENSTKAINLTIGAKQEETSDYDTGKVEAVSDYVPKTEGTQLVVMSISKADAASTESYTINIESSAGKKYTTTTNDCYKAFKYNTADGEKTETAEGYFIVVKVNNVPKDVTLTVTITPNN